jgi:serine/threonine protein kinase
MIVYDARRRPIELGEIIGRGGEAVVYRVLNQRDSLAKIYEPVPRPNYPLKLAWMVEHPPENPTQSLHHPSLAWPDGLFYDSKRKLVGYRMPHILDAVPLLEVFNPRRRAEVLPEFDRRYLHRTARNLAAAFSALHRSGYVAGDVNESNVLVTPTALVTLIDTDSFQVREERNGSSIIYPNPVAKPEYMPPELHGKNLMDVTRLPDHDAFGLAVLIFQLLMEGSHPFRAQWLGQGDPPSLDVRIAQGVFPYAEETALQVAPPKNAPGLDTLHPWLAELFRRCFVDGHRSPRWRPGPDLWARAIKQAEDALICCSEGHFYSGHLTRCPYCIIQQKRLQAAAARSADDRLRGDRSRGDRPRGGWTMPPLNRAGQAAPPKSATSGFRNPLGGFPGMVAPAGAAAGAAAGMGGRGSASASGLGVLRLHRVMRPGVVGSYFRTRAYKSFTVGAAQGALAGALPGALVALVNWSTAGPLDWTILPALSGASAGMVRGWKPGYRLGALVNRYLGWKYFWQGVGALIGMTLGGMFGLLFAWAIIPVFLGLILGARSGIYIGSKIWQLGNRVSWEGIWGTVSAVGAAALGWGIAGMVGSIGLNAVGAELAVGLLPFSGNGSLSWALLWILSGSLSGAIVGALSGFLIDLLGRLSALVN